ncbi:hypothetical protein [Bifidobacterium olomucense]|nr:hypothetical protein [Bifidobacterium sp. DSM 109959]
MSNVNSVVTAIAALAIHGNEQWDRVNPLAIAHVFASTKIAHIRRMPIRVRRGVTTDKRMRTDERAERLHDRLCGECDDGSRTAWFLSGIGKNEATIDTARGGNMTDIDLTNIDVTNLDLSALDRVAVWYGNLPDAAQKALSIVIGAVVAYVVFKIVAKIIKGIVISAIAAILAFLLATVPGNMILSNAYDRVEQQVTASLSQAQ